MSTLWPAPGSFVRPHTVPRAHMAPGSPARPRRTPGCFHLSAVMNGAAGSVLCSPAAPWNPLLRLGLSSLFRTPKCFAVLTAAGTWTGEDPELAAQAVASECVTRTSLQGLWWGPWCPSPRGGGGVAGWPRPHGSLDGGRGGLLSPFHRTPFCFARPSSVSVADHQEPRVNRTLRWLFTACVVTLNGTGVLEGSPL